jgi:serine/threonine protein phosphatase PrpC
MSRSFGDNVASSVGVSCDPEIIIRKLNSEDKFLCIASDGIWEFMDNKPVTNIVIPFYISG